MPVANRTPGVLSVPIEMEVDIVNVRKSVRQAANDVGFNVTDVTRIVTAASELARNIFRYANKGLVSLEFQQLGPRRGIKLTFSDNGPGIEDIDQAMQVGYSSANGLGLGLPGAKRLMDEMDISSRAGKGTTVSIVKWLNQN